MFREIEKVNFLFDIFLIKSKAQLLDYLTEYLSLSGGSSKFIITLNSKAVVKAKSDLKFREILQNKNHLIVADSAGIIWGLKLLRHPLCDKIPGIDLFHILCQIAHQNKYSVFLLGAKDEIVKSAAKNLVVNFPHLSVVGVENGYFLPEDNQKVVDKINENMVDILFVALGCPEQEKWVSKNISNLKVKICLGVGGTFDIIAGKRKRAPKIIRNWGGEWFFRILQEPRRITHLIDLLKFFLIIYRRNR